MIFEQLAIVVYGVIAMIAALVLSSQTGSPLATALVFVAAGLTYIFQYIQATINPNAPVLGWLFGFVVGALLLSILTSLWSAWPNVL